MAQKTERAGEQMLKQNEPAEQQKGNTGDGEQRGQ